MGNHGEGHDLCSIVFNSSNEFSLGVELEFQVIDPITTDLVPKAPLLMENLPESLKPAVTLEFIQSILEVQTGICSSVADVELDLRGVCEQTAALAQKYNTLLFAASLHPYAIAHKQELTDDPRYEKIMEELQIVGRRFITQGIHVHVGLPDGETAIRACDAIQPFLPILLSLSTSSPYYQGVDTGFMSYRTKLFEALPMAGLYGYIGSWEQFLEELCFLQQRGVISAIKDLWWDARPHPDFGTLEIRTCDLPTRFSDILGLTALIQALVVTLARGGAKPGPYSQPLLRYNKWQAARHGLRGSFIDPTEMLTEKKISLKEAVVLLLEKVRPAARELGSIDFLQLIGNIQEQGTGADQMRALYSQTQDYKQVIKDIHQRFWK